MTIHVHLIFNKKKYCMYVFRVVLILLTVIILVTTDRAEKRLRMSQNFLEKLGDTRTVCYIVLRLN